MRRKRKTARQRRQESYEMDRRAWEDFCPKLAAVQSFQEALLLVSDAVPPDAAGRRFYSNLGFFLETFGAPAGAGTVELHQYCRLIALFDKEGVLKAGVRPEVEARLATAIANRLVR